VIISNDNENPDVELEVHERAFLDLLHLGSPQAKLLLLRFCQGRVTREEALIEMRLLANLAVH